IGYIDRSLIAGLGLDLRTSLLFLAGSRGRGLRGGTLPGQRLPGTESGAHRTDDVHRGLTGTFTTGLVRGDGDQALAGLGHRVLLVFAGELDRGALPNFHRDAIDRHRDRGVGAERDVGLLAFTGIGHELLDARTRHIAESRASLARDLALHVGQPRHELRDAAATRSVDSEIGRAS